MQEYTCWDCFKSLTKMQKLHSVNGSESFTWLENTKHSQINGNQVRKCVALYPENNHFVFANSKKPW